MAEPSKTNKERLKEITDGIEAGIKELFQSDRFANYLRTTGRFHKYSVNNTLLIHMQKPDATLVAGFQKWKTQFGRNVKRGEKGITIIAPTPFKKKIEEAKLDPDTKLPMRDKDGKIIMEETEISIPMFKPVTVFDVSQTEGKPLPQLAASLNGRVQNFELMMEAVKRASPVPIVMEAMKLEMDGYFSLDRQKIALREGMGEAQTVCAAVHEMTPMPPSTTTNSRNRPPPRRVRNLQSPATGTLRRWRPRAFPTPYASISASRRARTASRTLGRMVPMASKLEMYSALADRTAHQITNSFSEWTAFLKTAARLYKYPFHEQLMIYAQKPDATACAEYDVWNQRMGRYVRRGSTGIALIDTTGSRPRLKYVFDLNDTGEGENSRYPHIWTYRHQYEGAVSKALENRFDVSGDEGLEIQLERAAAQLVDEYWNANQRDILGILADSFLEEYDDFSVGVAFRNAAVVSATYMLMYRCGIDPSEHFLHEDFLDVFDFNTPSTLAALGTGISQVSETVLRQIEATVKAEERKMSLTNEAERTENHGQQPDLHTDRGLLGAESGHGRERDAALGQVREDAPGVPSEGAPGSLERPHSDREAVPPLAGDRRDGGTALGGPDTEAGGGGRGDGGLEGPRSDEMGGPTWAQTSCS